MLTARDKVLKKMENFFLWGGGGEGRRREGGRRRGGAGGGEGGLPISTKQPTGGLAHCASTC